MQQSDDAPSPVLAFDLGGTRLKAGLVCGAEVSALRVVTLEHTDKRERLVEELLAIARAFLSLAPVQSIALCVRGIVDASAGVILDVNERLAQLIGYPLAQTFARELGLPTVMENDARMYALGEWLHGSGQGYSHLVCLTLGTGIGSGVILDGQLLRGSRHVGGILGGHFTIQANGPLCSCGNRGCLEALIGTSALVRMAEELLQTSPSVLHAESLTPRHIFAAAATGDLLANTIVEHFTAILGSGIVTMIHAYDPDIVVLGGGIMQASAQFLPAVQAFIDAHAWSTPRGRVAVLPAQLGDAAALVGVAGLASHEQLVR